MRVFLVENETATAAALATFLRAKSAVTDVAKTGEEALELVRHYQYDIVVLNLTLPDMDGYEVVRRMRAARIDVPVLILSGLPSLEAKLKAFALGVDDYVTKPYDRGELFARMQAIVRRSNGFSHPTLHIGSLVLNLGSREVATLDGTAVALTGKEYAVLELLALRKGAIVTKEAFLNHLYDGTDEPEVKIIDVFICKLRQKLARVNAGDLISTIWGRGYMIREPRNEPVHRFAEACPVQANDPAYLLADA